MNEIKEKIKTIMNLSPRFDLDDDDDNCLDYSTRENGDVGAEEYGEDDLREANRMAVRLKEVLGSAVVTDVETCDEWVFLHISF
jgi:hypothetical protein